VCFPRDVHTCHLRRLYGYDYRHGYTERNTDTDTDTDTQKQQPDEGTHLSVGTHLLRRRDAYYQAQVAIVV